MMSFILRNLFSRTVSLHSPWTWPRKKELLIFPPQATKVVRSYEYNFQPSDVELLGPGAGTAHNFSAPGDPPRLCPATLYSAGRYHLFVPFNGISLLFPQAEWELVLRSGYLFAGYRGNVVAGGASDNIAERRSDRSIGIF